MNEPSVIGLRKADFWTSIVLLAVGAGMLASALSMPLEGTYAGVTNAWYVSPALFPMIVAAFLILLSLILLVNAVRTGGARFALQSVGDFRADGAAKGSEAFWIVSGALAAYIYILVPRIDFIAATTLLLFTLVSAFDIRSTRAARRVLLIFFATAVAVLAVTLVMSDPAPRSTEAYIRDALVWGVIPISMAAVAAGVRHDPEQRSRLVRCVWVSVLTPVLLGTVFKYGLLVPLPNEGITIEILDRIRYGVPSLMGTGA